MKSNMRVCLLPFLVAFAVGMMPGGKAEAGRPRGGPGGRRPPPLVSVGKVIERKVRNRLTAVGTVEAYRTSTVSSEIQGIVKSFPLRKGDPVAAGKTVIARLQRTDIALDHRVYLAELAKATEDYLRLKRGSRKEEIETLRARLADREARRKRDEQEFKRTEDLYRRKILDRSRYDTALANYQSSKSQFTEAESNLRLAEAGPRREEVAKAAAEVDRVKAKMAVLKFELSKTVIRSPLTGFLTEKYLEVGQWVQKGGKVAEVVELDKVLVVAAISEKQITQVKVGGIAEVRLDAIPGRIFKGHLRRIVPKADPKSRTFPVEIELENTPDIAIKAGMFARVSKEYGAESRAILVPKDAVIQRPQGMSVFVLEKGRVREVSFPSGKSVDSFVEAPADRLKPGMTVVTVGNENLRNGMQVHGQGGPRGRGDGPRSDGAPRRPSAERPRRDGPQSGQSRPGPRSGPPGGGGKKETKSPEQGASATNGFLKALAVVPNLAAEVADKTVRFFDGLFREQSPPPAAAQGKEQRAFRSAPPGASGGKPPGEKKPREGQAP
ncbi:MAG: efflux RND transporter periplasmic adaptor subunit [Nitrospinota bacterium]|nr:efflux RND transporter periplasmic adaptor subunit [Nitrospinota bacterium]